MEKDLFQLRDEQYYNDLNQQEDVVRDFFKQNRLQGLLIGCPQKVDIKSKPNLPFIVSEKRSFKDIREVPYDKFAVVCAIDLDRGISYTNLLEQIPDNIIFKPTEGQEKPIPEGTTFQFKVYDLRERLPLPWEITNLLVTIFLNDIYSNRAYVTLSENNMTSEAVSAEITKELTGKPQPMVNFQEEAPYPCYSKVSDSPREPDKPGIALSCKQSFSIENKEPFILSGSFLVPVFPHEQTMQADGQSPSAIVPVSLLVSGTHQEIVGTLNFNVPTKATIDNTGKQPRVKGYFTLNLKQYFKFEETPQQYTLYVFSRELLSKVQFQLVK